MISALVTPNKQPKTHKLTKRLRVDKLMENGLMPERSAIIGRALPFTSPLKLPKGGISLARDSEKLGSPLGKSPGPQG